MNHLSQKILCWREMMLTMSVILLVWSTTNAPLKCNVWQILVLDVQPAGFFGSKFGDACKQQTNFQKLAWESWTAFLLPLSWSSWHVVTRKKQSNTPATETPKEFSDATSFGIHSSLPTWWIHALGNISTCNKHTSKDAWHGDGRIQKMKWHVKAGFFYRKQTVVEWLVVAQEKCCSALVQAPTWAVVPGLPFLTHEQQKLPLRTFSKAKQSKKSEKNYCELGRVKILVSRWNFGTS